MVQTAYRRQCCGATCKKLLTFFALRDALGAELITFAAHGEDVARLLRMIFQTLAQHGDVDIDSARKGGAVSPNIMEQGSAAERDTSMFDELAQQKKLFRGEGNLPAVFEEAPAEKVDVDVAEAEVCRSGGGGTAQHGLDAGVQLALIDRFDKDFVGGGFKQGDFFFERDFTGEDKHGQFGTEPVDLAAKLDGGTVGARDANEYRICSCKPLGLQARAGKRKNVG